MEKLQEPTDPIPPSWQDLTSTRERLARMETKLDIILADRPVLAQRQEAFDARLNALEIGRLANRGDIDAIRKRMDAFDALVDSYDIMTPAASREWKKSMDDMLVKFNEQRIVVATAQSIRAKDWAMIVGVFTVITTIAGVIARLI